MIPQETAMVTTLLDRLKETPGQLKDPEAETLIGRAVAEQPDTAYYLAQTVLIQDLSLHSARSRIAELEKSLVEAKTAAVPPPSFLTGFLPPSGPTNPAASTAIPSAPNAVASPPPSYAPQSGNPVPGLGGMVGGGFLRGAAMTAAGVAGGALLFEGIQSIFGQHGAADIIGDQAPVAGLGEPRPGQEIDGSDLS
jgi:uncharacterized protein